MAIRKEKEEICGRLSTRVVYITEDGKRFCQESEAFLHGEYLKWQQTARKMGVKCIDGGYYCKNEQALATVVIMISFERPHPTDVGWGFYGLAPVKPR